MQKGESQMRWFSFLHFNTLAMKKIICLVAPIILAATMRCMGQVTISPEIGISYLPFTIYGSSSITQSNRIDYLLGISGNFLISEKWYVNTRVSYTRREPVTWINHNFAQDYIYELKHNDLNIDFSANYKISKTFHIGAGPIIVRQINSTLSSMGEIFGESYSYPVNRFQYGIQSALSADFRVVVMKLEYARKILNAEPIILYGTTGKDRYNMTLAVPIGKRKKR